MGDDDKSKDGGAAKVESAVAVIEVTFREVSAIYDLYGHRRVIGPASKPKVVIDTSAFFDALVSGDDPAYEDMFGNAVKKTKARDMPGVYQGQRIDGTGSSLRTFSRELVREIDDKWLYVFFSQKKNGDNPSFYAELRFEKGKFQRVDMKEEGGKDERAPSGDATDKLYLEVQTIEEDGFQYFFLLTAYQLPWDGIFSAMVGLGRRLMSGCERLFDMFWTDGYTSGGDPKPLFELTSELAAGTPLGFRVYLVDPFQEALRRATLYQEMLGYWQAIQGALNDKDNEYLLAKRLEQISLRSSDYSDIVWPELGPYLAKKEELSRAFLRATTNRLEDLMRWIGEDQMRDDWGEMDDKGNVLSSDTWYRDEDGNVSLTTTPNEDREAMNPFCDLVGGYNLEGTPKETFDLVSKIVASVNARLSEMPRGQDFMVEMINEDFKGKLPGADGGAKLLFEAGRKGTATVTEGVAKTFEHYIPAWIQAYKKEALPALIKAAEKKLGLELKKIKPHTVKRAEIALARRAHKKASKKGIDKLAEHYHLALEPDKVAKAHFTEAALNGIMLAIEVFNLEHSLDELRDEPDIWTALGFFGSSLDAYSALTKVVPKTAAIKFTYAGTKRVIEIAPTVAIVSSAIDTVLAARDLVSSTNFEQQAGNAMRTVGSYLTLGGAMFAETGFGTVAAVVGLGLEAIGSWLVSDADEMKLFLRHCKWGDRSTRDEVSDTFSDKNGFGYGGKLEDLADDITSQLRALDWMFFVFQPNVVAHGGRNYMKNEILVNMNPPKGLTPAAKWSFKLDVVGDDSGGVIKSYEWKPDDEYDEAYLSSDDDIAIVSVEQHYDTDDASMRQAWGEVHVKGDITLDVFGDGTSLVVRSVNEGFDLQW
jgi:hypothetical protein